MKKYSAIVKDENRTVFIENQEYENKAAFIYDLRKNGYKVNPRKVKPSDVLNISLTTPTATPGIGISKPSRALRNKLSARSKKTYIKEKQTMTRAEINTAFTSKVAEYLAKGYTFNTNTMNGSQGEITKVDLTDGTEIVRVLLDSLSDYDTWDGGLEIIVGRVTDTKIHPHEVGGVSSTIWNNRLEILETERFYKLGSDRRNGIFYGTKAEAEKAAAIKRERYIANITGGVTENITDKEDKTCITSKSQTFTRERSLTREKPRHVRAP